MLSTIVIVLHILTHLMLISIWQVSLCTHTQSWRASALNLMTWNSELQFGRVIRILENGISLHDRPVTALNAWEMEMDLNLNQSWHKLYLTPVRRKALAKLPIAIKIIHHFLIQAAVPFSQMLIFMWEISYLGHSLPLAHVGYFHLFPIAVNFFPTHSFICRLLEGDPDYVSNIVVGSLLCGTQF